MNNLGNQMRREAERVMARLTTVRIGFVTSYDPAHYCAKVKIQPEGQISGWLPIGSSYVGSGWGMYTPPSIGETVIVVYQEGNDESGIIVGRMFGSRTPPLAVPSGEAWLVHESGTFLKMTNDGKMLVNSASDLDVNVEGNANVTVEGATNLTSAQNVTITTPTLAVVGNITATGDITDQVDGTAESMRSQRANFDLHTHSGTQPGSGNTGIPNQLE